MSRGRGARHVVVRPGAVGLVAVATLLTGVPSDASGQDVEALARLRGTPLPQAYYDQVRADPWLYEFERDVPGLASPAAVSTSSIGEVAIPVILALFKDSPEVPRISREDVQEVLFSGPASRGTITEAYLEM